MKAEPLKDKITTVTIGGTVYGWLLKKEDVAAAVEWLKEEYSKIMALGIVERKDVKAIAELKKLIDKAFPGVVEVRDES